MRKIFFLFVLLCCSYESQAIDLNGKFVSQSGELMFRFTSDSLYVDIAQSQRNVSTFKLVKTKDGKKSVSFDAYESYLENGRVTYRQVLIRVSKEKGNKLLLEYFGKDKDRDYNTNEVYHIKQVD